MDDIQTCHPHAFPLVVMSNGKETEEFSRCAAETDDEEGGQRMSYVELLDHVAVRRMNWGRLFMKV